MKQFLKSILPAILCLAFISCTTNISNDASISVTIPDDARAVSRTSLVYTFTLATAEGAVFGTQSGTASKTIKFANIEPGDYVLTVVGAPAEDPADVQWEGSESFTLKAGDNKKIAIKMKVMDIFKMNDGGIVMENTIKPKANPHDENNYRYHSIDISGFQKEMVVKFIASGSKQNDPLFHVGDTLLFSIKGKSSLALEKFYYLAVGTQELNWSTFNAPIEANKEFEIYIPVNAIPESFLSNLGSVIPSFVIVTENKTTFSDLEIGLKVYRANQKTGAVTFIMNKACVDGKYRYEGLALFGSGYASYLDKGSTHTLYLAGNTKKNAAVELALVNYGSYQDLTTTNETSKPTLNFKKDQKLNENVNFTINNNRIDDTLGVQFISYCENKSYKDVLGIYNLSLVLDSQAN